LQAGLDHRHPSIATQVILAFATMQYFYLQKFISFMMGDIVTRPANKTEYMDDKIAVTQAGVCH